MDKKELQIFIGMSRALNEINRENNKIYTKYGLTMAQFGVLEALYHKGPLTVGQVQEKILSTSGTIPVIVKNLEKNGFITRRQDEKDKRKVILTITGKGRDLMDKVYPLNEETIISKMNIWTQEEQIQLVKLMKKFGGLDNGEENS